ncbi:MAG: dihydrofolate reductase [Bacteroidia bacterium]|nr:dihydrofolate reductase [Bacteroidia bacterium]
MEISLVVATSINGAIGKDNQLLWHLPADLKRFKELTTGHPIIMGRKTFESIGRPLPNRSNIVISRNKDQKFEGVFMATSLSEAIQLCPPQSEPKIIGGGEIYAQSIGIASKIYLTKVHVEITGDTYFPEIVPSQWKETQKEIRLKDEKNPFDMEFITLEKI